MTSCLRNSSDVTVCCYHCVEHIKLHTCSKFDDHWSNNNNVPQADSSKKPMSNRVKGRILVIWVELLFPDLTLSSQSTSTSTLKTKLTILNGMDKLWYLCIWLQNACSLTKFRFQSKNLPTKVKMIHYFN